MLKAAGNRVVTYDRRGFGRSDKPKSGYGYDTLTDDLHAVLTGLELDDVTLVGFSMGGAARSLATSPGTDPSGGAAWFSPPPYRPA